MKQSLGELALSHDVISALYTLAFSLSEDCTFTKDDALNDVVLTIQKMQELIELLSVK